MSITDSILSFMKINGGDDDQGIVEEEEKLEDNEDVNEPEDEEQVEVELGRKRAAKPKNRFFGKKASGDDSIQSRGDNFESDDDEVDYTASSSRTTSSRTSSTGSNSSNSRYYGNTNNSQNNLYSIKGSKASRRTGASRGMEVCVTRPANVESCQQISDIIASGRVAVFNMTDLDDVLCQRIVDFVSGTCYAIHGDIQLVSDKIFIATPQSIDITGDLDEIQKMLSESVMPVEFTGYPDAEGE